MEELNTFLRDRNINITEDDLNRIYKDTSLLSLVSCPNVFTEQISMKDKLLHDGEDVNQADNMTKLMYKMNYPTTPFKIEFKHLLKYIYYRSGERKIPRKLEEYWKDNHTFFEKSFIRCRLLTSAWDPATIEELIERYYGNSVNYEELQVRYKLLELHLGYTQPQQDKRRGRPGLPDDVKVLIRKLTNKKNAKDIKMSYDLKRDLRKTFTLQEIEAIQEYVKDKTLKEKLNVLKPYL